MKYKIIIFLVFILNMSFLSAAVPNMEGLFRNLSNNDFVGPGISLKIQIKEAGASSDAEGNKYLKLIFAVDDGQIDLLQVDYKSLSFLDPEILKLKHLSSFNKVAVSDSNVERAVFYSVFSMFSTNMSKPIVLLLKKIDSDFLLNSQIMNEEQVRLYSRQRRHLVAVKSGAILDTAPSPLRPQDEEDKRKIAEILNQDMFKKSNNVFLTKEGGPFFWKLKLKNIEGHFGADDITMQALKINYKENQYAYSFSGYTFFNSEILLPKFVNYKSSQGKDYEIQILSVESVGLSRQKIMEKYRPIEEKILKLKGQAQPHSLPFTY